MRVALTGSRDGYFHDYTGRAQELISTVKRGFLYQGQYYYWQQQSRGSPMPAVPAWACIHYLQNHDQVGNTGVGERLHTLSMPARYRACTGLLLLGPQTPLLFMGQEFLASTGFKFFADHDGELRQLVHAGRRQFLRQFRGYATPSIQAAIVDPASQAAFEESKLQWRELQQRGSGLALHRDLLALRRTDPVICRQAVEAIDGATLSEYCLVLRWFDLTHGDRLLVVNLDRELVLEPAPEPLLAPPSNCNWSMLWSSEDASYAGSGAVNPVSEDQRWRVPANCAVLLQATMTSAQKMSS
jgi:maltooligosyltrehalose trehalohydrolase